MIVRLPISPGRASQFLVAAILGIAIGVSTTVFSLLDAVVLDATPFPRPDRLFVLQCREPGSAAALNCPLSAAIALATGTATIDELGYYGFGPARLEFPGSDPQLMITRRVSSSFFSTLGTMPALGRWFLASDNGAIGNSLIVLSDTAWRTRFGGQADIIGRTLHLDGVPYEVCGVMPRGFAFPTSDVQGWVLEPLTVAALEQANHQDVTILARLGKHSNADQLRADLRVQVSRLLDDHGRPLRLSLDAVPAKDFILGTGSRLISLLFLGTLALLLIVMGNTVNLLAAHFMSAHADYLLRIALGATPLRLLRQRVAEALALTPAAAALGIAIAATALSVVSQLGGLNISRSEFATIGTRTCLFAVLLSLLVLVASTLLAFTPMLLTMRLDRLNRHPGSNRRSTWRPLRLLQMMSLAIQMGLSVVLVLTASVALQALEFAWHPPLGFEARGLITVSVRAPNKESDGSTKLAQGLLEDVRKVPRVEGAALSSSAPLRGALFVPSLYIARDGAPPISTPMAQIHYVSTDYFRLLHIPVLTGSAVMDADSPPGQCPIVINNTMAQLLGGASAAIGSRVSRDPNPTTTAQTCVVRAVVGDTRDIRVQQPAGPQAYLPISQRSRGDATIIVRTDDATGYVVETLRSLIKQQYQPLRLDFITNVWDSLQGATQRERLVGYQILFFAVAGYGAAFMGILAMVQRFMNERRSEIGVRLALGARRASIVSLLSREFAVTIGIGCLVGMVLAYNPWAAVDELLGRPVQKSVGAVAWATLVVASSAWGILLARAALFRMTNLTSLLREP